MSDDRPAIDTLSFEQAQAELEQIVERLEDQKTGLEEALALWERGEALHRHCQSKLDYAAAKIEQLTVTVDEAAAVVAETSQADFQPSDEPAREPATVPANGAPAADDSDDGGMQIF
jgi:exodeoxyribonuclease VII small subunit